MAATPTNRTPLRFPGHPTPVSGGHRLPTSDDAARPLPQPAVRRELYDEVLENIHRIIRGDEPVRAVW